jgi:hypothetical protein
METRSQLWLAFMLIGLALLACGGSAASSTPTLVDRYSLLPEHKVAPAEDQWPPVIAAGWSRPVPLPYPLSTSGGEDSPFITPDGQTLYFFFTPDVSIPAERQLLDGVTGIWVAQRSGETWSEPQRVWLEGRTEIALDGCEFVLGDRMYFCTARTGYTGVQWFRAELKDGLWQDWAFAGDELRQSEYEVGELHLSVDGQELYFGSTRAGGYGASDLWVAHMTADGWGEPTDLGPQVNTASDESRPFLSPDGGELWYTGTSRKGLPGPAVFLSLRQPDGSWGAPEEIASSFAGEPTLSGDGRTLYFVHHYYSADLGTMLEADVYVSTRQ